MRELYFRSYYPMYESNSTLYKDWKTLMCLVSQLKEEQSSFHATLLTHGASLLEHIYFLLEKDNQKDPENTVRLIKTGLFFLQENIPLYYKNSKNKNIVQQLETLLEKFLKDVGKYTIKRKKVLILYFGNQYGNGSGHQMSAFAVRDGLLHSFGKDYDIELLDLVDATSTTLYALVGMAYGTVIKKQPKIWQWLFKTTNNKGAYAKIFNLFSSPMMLKEVKKIFTEKHPDLIISTFPWWDYIVQKVKSTYPVKIPYVSIITDSISVHRMWWMNPLVDYFIVANTDTAHVLLDNKIPMEKIKPLGFPLRLPFYEPVKTKEIKEIFGLAENKKTILHMIGTMASKKDVELALYLDQHLDPRQYQQILLFGNNYKLQKKFEKTYPHLKTSLLFGWTDKVPQLMGVSDLLITKAGGTIVMEAVQKMLPTIITRVIPGQEEGNLTLLQKYGVGTLAVKKEDLLKVTTDMLKKDRIREMERNFSKIRTDMASFKIAQFIKTLLEK